MHERSVATTIADAVRRRAHGHHVTRVQVKIGNLWQVTPRTLTRGWQALTKDTSLEGCSLVLEEVPARGRCRACGMEGALPPFPLSCSNCGSFDVEVMSGDELLVGDLEVDE
jgi:hydrogenase nickel incorporation protein HypA/HybF